MSQPHHTVYAEKPLKPFLLVSSIVLWERYGWYGMQVLLVYFMIKKMGCSDVFSDNTFAAFAALAYAFLGLGGYVGDKILGCKRTIALGAIVLALGYLLLGIDPYGYFFYGLGTIVAGNALFKSNPSALVSKLYAPGDHRIDGVYTMYYMAINVGSFIASLSGPIIAEYYGWNMAFFVSFLGLMFAMLGYMMFHKVVSPFGSEPDFKPLNIFSLIIVICCTAALALVSAFLLAHLTVVHMLLYAALIIVIIFFIKIVISAAQNERAKLIVCMILIAEAVLFFVLYQQRATSLNLFVVRNTRHYIFGIPLNPLSFQAFNPLWIFIVSPIIAISFTKLAKKKKDFSLPSKFAMGMFLCSLGFFLLKASQFFADKHGLVAGEWVFFGVGFMSVGEILIGGIGLAMIARLVPQRVMGFMMGTWFMSTAIAMVLGGFVAAVASIPEGITNPVLTLPIYTDLFFKLGIATLIISIIMAITAPKLKKYMS
jgi:proton-dependent oligopeptide transporter, POT family